MLLGQSGSGKSTLLSLIAGILRPGAGVIEVAGAQISAMSARQRDRLRAEKIGIVFQQFNLLPFATALDNVMLSLRFAPTRRSRVPDPRAEALRLCAALGLPPACMTKQASALSVGQQQRVAVARALIGAPPLLLADEPTSALDAASQAAFLDLLIAQAAAQNAAILMVSHDTRLGAQFDRVVMLEDLMSPDA